MLQAWVRVSIWGSRLDQVGYIGTLINDFFYKLNKIEPTIRLSLKLIEQLKMWIHNSFITHSLKKNVMLNL